MLVIEKLTGKIWKIEPVPMPSFDITAALENPKSSKISHLEAHNQQKLSAQRESKSSQTFLNRKLKAKLNHRTKSK